VLSLLLYWGIQHSRLGLQIRALASDEALAQVSGIRPLAVTVLIWFIAGVAGGLAGAFWGVGASVSPLLGWRQLLIVMMVTFVGVSWGLGGVIAVGVGTAIALAGMALQFDQVLYAQVVLIVAFIAILKVRSLRATETAKV
jgi:branched-chain amino acid transport system permease protein